MATTVLDYKGIMVLIWTLWGTALATTIFRIASQIKLQRRLFADDHFVLGGMVTLTALSAVITRLLPQFYLAGEYTKAVMLDPLTPLPLPQDEFMARTSTSLKLMFSQMLLFWTTLWAAKFSILFFVKRLVQGLPVYVRAWWACFAAVMILYLGCMLSNFLTCTPLDKYWSATGCSDPEDLVRADVSIKFATTADVVADLIIMILPLKLIWKLKTNAKNKAGLALLFSLGAIIIAFALVRMAQVTKATSQTAQDPTTVANGPVLLSMWSHIESSVSVIVATLPAFRFLLRQNRDRLMSRQTPGYNNGYGSKGSSKWKKQSVRLAGADSHHTGESSSQTELRLVAGIHKKVEYRVEEFSEDPDLDDNVRRTRQIFQ